MAREEPGDDPSLQLQDELSESIQRAHATRRPILTHLNADTTWLLSIPYPTHVKAPAGRCRFNILIDPWLKGPQSDVAGWFSTQWHAIKSSVESIQEVEQLLQEAEALELRTLRSPSARRSTSTTKSHIDVVVVSHEFTDHCHEATLKEVHPSVPVYATAKAVELISSWSHFDAVVNMAVFNKGGDWRETSQGPIPSWIGVSRLVTEQDALYYHSAVIICVAEGKAGSAEAIIYTPHGVQASTFSILQSAIPSVHTLAFLHGLHDVSITLTKQLNLGAHNALKAQRLLNAKYWVGTHDEVKIGGGLLAPFLRRKAHTFLDALAQESSSSSASKEMYAEDVKAIDEVSYCDLASGESLLLN